MNQRGAAVVPLSTHHPGRDRQAFRGMPAYVVAKHGVAGLTRAAALGYGATSSESMPCVLTRFAH
jgi:NAD(P)-dependent dehydrogenase (short-subunit alcohol dehydrogenase family)